MSYFTISSCFRRAGGGKGAYRRRKVVHDEFELALTNALRHFVGDLVGAHLRLQIVGCDARRWDHVAHLVLELLLDTAVEEEGDMCVLLGLGNVALLQLLLCEPFSEDIVHALRREGHREGVVGLVLRHRCDVNVLRDLDGFIGDVGVVNTEHEGDFTDTVRTVVEEEEGVIVWGFVKHCLPVSECWGTYP
jgi:hypothetical protein